MKKVVLIELECGHQDPFSRASYEEDGLPSTWWCNRCRKSFKVKGIVDPQPK